MKKQYYYQRDGEKIGPFNEAQFKDLHLNPDTLIWCYGMEDWMTYKDYAFQEYTQQQANKTARSFSFPKLAIPKPSKRAVKIVAIVFASVVVLCGLVGLGYYLIDEVYPDKCYKAAIRDLEAHWVAAPDQEKLEMAYDILSTTGWFEWEYRGKLYYISYIPCDTKDSAAQFIKDRAKAGDPRAMYFAGKGYYNGLIHFENDNKRAAYWFKKAADEDNAEACEMMYKLYINGKGVLIDHERALVYLRKSAALGNSEALYELGRYYKDGYRIDTYNQNGLVISSHSFVKQNLDSARYYLQLAADDGYEKAAVELEHIIIEEPLHKPMPKPAPKAKTKSNSSQSDPANY